MEKVSTGKYGRIEPEKIQALPFLYCLLHHREKAYPHSTALVIQDIISAQNGPGKVLFLDDYTVNDLLTTLHDLALIRIEMVGGLEQIRLGDDTSKESVLKAIYKVGE